MSDEGSLKFSSEEDLAGSDRQRSLSPEALPAVAQAEEGQERAEEAEDPQRLETSEAPRAHSALQSWAKGRKDKSKPGLPVLSAVTVNSMTYDLDMMLDPKVQRTATDRLSSTLNLSSSDFVKLNRESAGKPQASRSKDDAGKARPSYPDQTNVEERFYKYRKNVEEKVKHMEEELRKKEKAACTFVPTIIGRQGPAGEVSRSPEEFYQEMLRHKHVTDEKLKYMREESSKSQKSVEGAYFKPQLCAKSVSMVEGKGEQSLPVHEKLYQAHKLQMQKQLKSTELGNTEASQTSTDSAKMFSPAINKASQNLIREKPIEVHLLEDAERRLKRLEAVPAKPSPTKSMNSHSEAMLLRKFKEELGAAWTALDEEATGALNYTKTGELLKALKFIENDSEGKHYEAERASVRSMWNLLRLSEDSMVTRSNLEPLLLAVMNFHVEEKQLEEPEEGQSDSSRGIGRLEADAFVLNPGDSKRLHFHFKAWYEHRIRSLNRAAKAQVAGEEEHCTFKPSISKVSKKLVEDNASRRAADGHSRLEDFLTSEHVRKQARQKELQEKALRDEMKECQFKPKTDKKSAKILAEAEPGASLSGDYLKILKEAKPQDKTEALFQLAVVTQQRRKKLEKTPEDLEIEKQEVECTFAPDLRKTRNFLSGAGAFSDPPKGVDKVLERMTRARQDAEEVRVMRESGLSYRGKKEKKQAESKAEGPLVVLAVQVSGRAEELRVRPGDDLDGLISIFAAQHRLSSAETALVAEQLRSQYEQATGSAADD